MLKVFSLVNNSVNHRNFSRNPNLTGDHVIQNHTGCYMLSPFFSFCELIFQIKVDRKTNTLEFKFQLFGVCFGGAFEAFLCCLGQSYSNTSNSFELCGCNHDIHGKSKLHEK